MTKNALIARVRTIAALIPIVALMTLGGCSYSLNYNQAYLAAARRPVETRVDGAVLVYTSAMDDQYVFTGPPTSLTGGATKAAVPLGLIMREAAKAAFADMFRGGAEAASGLDHARDVRVIINPRPVTFSYQYAQLRNLGFAITPLVELTAEVRVLDTKGDVVWHRDYASGEVTGPSYMVNFSPEEEINKAAHKAAYDLMAKAAADVAAEIAGHGPRVGAAPVVRAFVPAPA